MVSAEEVVLEWVCPMIGTVLANIMWYAPYQAVRHAVLEGEGLGDLNPTPWAFVSEASRN